VTPHKRGDQGVEACAGPGEIAIFKGVTRPRSGASQGGGEKEGDEARRHASRIH
jgi:hypothetical protein